MKQYLDLLRDVINNGFVKDDRTGAGTLSVFGRQLRFDLKQGFPLVTTKKIHLPSVIHELLWFLSGDTNVKYLNDNGVTIWDKWADEDGYLGPVYGRQFRNWKDPNTATYDKIGLAGGVFFQYIDQITQLVEGLKTRPFSRRHIVSAWNVADLPDESLSPQENVANGKMALAPCHCLFQFNVRRLKAEDVLAIEPFRNDIPEYALSCRLDQRSADVFLGMPFNIASYALLTHMVADICNMLPDELIWQGGDVHLYMNHGIQAMEQLRRDPFPLPTLRIKRKPGSIFDYQADDFELLNYQYHPAIKAPVAV